HQERRVREHHACRSLLAPRNHRGWARTAAPRKRRRRRAAVRLLSSELRSHSSRASAVSGAQLPNAQATVGAVREKSSQRRRRVASAVIPSRPSASKAASFAPLDGTTHPHPERGVGSSQSPVLSPPTPTPSFDGVPPPPPAPPT